MQVQGNGHPHKKREKDTQPLEEETRGKKIKFLSFLSDTLQTLKHKCVGSTLWIFLCRKRIILKYVCVCGWVCEWVPKHTQSTVKHFLAYLPPRAGQRWMGELKRWERVKKKKEQRKQRKVADQIKWRVFSSRTLASQRERQRQSECRKREKLSWRERGEERSEGEVEEGTVKLREGRQAGSFCRFFSSEGGNKEIMGVAREMWEKGDQNCTFSLIEL